MGAVAGPAGIAAGSLAGWLYGRVQQHQQAGLRDMANNQAGAAGAELDAGVNWDPGGALGGYSGAGESGPAPTYGTGPSGDLSSAPDYGGTYPDFSNYGDALAGYTDSDGNFLFDPNATARGPGARRDGTMPNARGSSIYGNGPRSDFQGTVTDFNVGGQDVILGSGDPNSMYRARMRDYG